MPLEGDVDATAAGLTALVAERTSWDIMIRSVTWASVYSMNARLADRYRVGRVFLPGDAAHTHPPTGRPRPEHQLAGQLQSRLEARGRAGRCARETSGNL